MLNFWQNSLNEDRNITFWMYDFPLFEKCENTICVFIDIPILQPMITGSGVIKIPVVHWTEEADPLRFSLSFL